MSAGFQSRTVWMAGSFGVSVHWTNHSKPLHGKAVSYEDAVAAFPVEPFVAELVSMKAQHCIFVLSHAEQYLPMPHPLLDLLLPERTATRDLVGDLARALKSAGIRLILYYNHSCNGEDDPIWTEVCGYRSGNLDCFAARICMIVEIISRRYAGLFDGWWFDSSYTLDDCGPYQTVSRELKGWKFPWNALLEAARAGDPEHLCVTLNSGGNCRFLYADDIDYYAGETGCPALEFPQDGPPLQDHRWMTMDCQEWVHALENTPFQPPRFSDEELIVFLRETAKRGIMVTFNMEISQEGILAPESVAQLRRINPMTKDAQG